MAWSTCMIQLSQFAERKYVLKRWRIYILIGALYVLITSVACDSSQVVNGSPDTYLGMTMKIDRPEASRRDAKIGDTVHVTLKLVNFSDKNSQTLDSASSRLMDIEIACYGNRLARWSDQAPPEGVFNHLELAPGAQRTIEMTWVPDERARQCKVLIRGALYEKNAPSYFLDHQLPVEYTYP